MCKGLRRKLLECISMPKHLRIPLLARGRADLRDNERGQSHIRADAARRRTRIGTVPLVRAIAAAVAVVCLGLTPPLRAAEDLSPAVRKLLRQLDAPQLAERDAAERALIALGPAALPLLPDAQRELTPEVRQRVARIRLALQQTHAAAGGGAAEVTLQVENRPLSDVLAELERQTGNRLIDARRERGQPAENPRMSLDFQKLPFWTAFDRLLDQAGLSVDMYGADGALQLIAPTERTSKRAARAAYCGPFRLEPLTVIAQSDLRSPASGVLRIQLEIAWEPRLRPINLLQRAADMLAFDESGRPLALENPRATIETVIHRRAAALQMQVLWKLPPRDVRQIARLQGTLRALLPGPPETFTFERLAPGVRTEQRIAAARVAVDRVRREGENWAIEMTLRFDQADAAFESHRGWVFDNEAWLEDAAGKRILPIGSETLRQTQNELGVKRLFDGKTPLDDCRFRYRTPVLIQNVAYPYVLTRIDLP